MTNEIETPPAFPFVEHGGNGQIYGTVTGMSLRDYFAAKAMQMLAADDSLSIKYVADALGIAESEYQPRTHWNQFVSDESYRVADAMLKARSI